MDAEGAGNGLGCIGGSLPSHMDVGRRLEAWESVVVLNLALTAVQERICKAARSEYLTLETQWES